MKLRPGSLSGPRRPSLEILANSTHLTDVDSLAGLARFCSCLWAPPSNLPSTWWRVCSAGPGQPCCSLSQVVVPFPLVLCSGLCPQSQVRWVYS